MTKEAADMFLSPEILVVEASAGSGKTYALARRYVQRLLHLTRQQTTPPLHSILAITFTNKAAFEMKERILRLLKQLALGIMPEEESGPLLLPMGMDTDEAMALAQRIMQVVLRHYNYFQVETIDKFISALLVSSAFQLGLTANFRIRTHARDYLARALDTVVERARHDAALARIVDDFLTSMLLVESRSSWFPGEIVLDTVEKLFNEHNAYGLEFAHGGVAPQDLIAAKAAVLAQVKAFASPFPEGINARFAAAVEDFLEHNQGVFSFKGLPGSFQSEQASWMKKGSIPSPWHEACWADIRQGLARAAELEVAHLYDPYIALFARVREVFDAACKRDDVVFLGQLNARAREVYAGGAGVDELYYRLAVRYDHYLLDEFQDTSLLQWENLRALPEEAIARGGSLFYVGDKKQAIYAFRGGDTRLFDDVAACYSAPDYHCRRTALEKNYRSCRSVVEFNNRVFSLENLERLMTAVDDKGKRLVPARSCDMDELRRVYGLSHQTAVMTGPAGYVRLEVLAGARKDDYREDARLKVLARLRSLRERFAWAQMVVLVRKNDDVELLTRWLLQAGIPAVSDRTLDIRQNPLVQEIVAFVKFLADPSDNIALAGFILGEVFLAASGLEAGDVQDFIMDWRQRRLMPLYQAFAGRYPGIWQDLAGSCMARCGLYPLYELLVGFLRQTQALERFPLSQGFLMRFLELVKSCEEECPGIDEFLEWYEALEGDEVFVEGLDGDTDGGAVRVMTVHKAKGLEFPVVVMPFLAMGLQGASSAGNRALAYNLQVEDGKLKLYHFTSAHLPYSVAAEQLDVQADMDAFFSELNNLYVALTRAGCEMHGFIPLKAGNACNLALSLFPPDAYEVGVPAEAYPRHGLRAEDVVRKLLPPACRDWMPLLREEFLPLELAGHERQDAGKALHAVLARIHCFPPGGERRVVQEALAQDARLRGMIDEDALVSALAQEDIRVFFSPEAGEVHCEYSLIDGRGGAHRIDRLIIAPGEIVVVDFKTGRFSPEDEAQIITYKDLLRQVYPGRMVRGFLVSIQERKVVEVR